MIVRMQSKGHSITGIRISKSDARRLFPWNLKSVDLELDHLRIRCDLQSNFWLDRPEISDPRLSSWLEEKLYWQKLPRTPLSVEMVRAGDSYRLQIRPSCQASKPGFGLIA
jgi:hypothetical protein